MTGRLPPWRRSAPAPAVPGPDHVHELVAYTALCPYGEPAEWAGARVRAYGESGDGAEVTCLCRCAGCLVALAAHEAARRAVADGVQVAPC